MLLRLSKLWVALALLIAVWALGTLQPTDQREWIRPVGSSRGPVKILQFYASVGVLTIGEKAMLCYGVENAKTVRISPVLQDIYPSANHCVEIVPEHTTHYTILAEGFDGVVATRSITLAVQPVAAPKQGVIYASLR